MGGCVCVGGWVARAVHWLISTCACMPHADPLSGHVGAEASGGWPAPVDTSSPPAYLFSSLHDNASFHEVGESGVRGTSPKLVDISDISSSEKKGILESKVCRTECK